MIDKSTPMSAERLAEVRRILNAASAEVHLRFNSHDTRHAEEMYNDFDGEEGGPAMGQQ